MKREFLGLIVLSMTRVSLQDAGQHSLLRIGCYGAI